MSDFMTCGNASITLEQALSAIMTKTSTGDISVRTMLVEACATDAIDCSNNAVPLDQLLKSAIGIDAGCAKPALRLGITVEALATHLGLAFASNAAAKAALGGGGFTYYDTTLNAWGITLP